MAQPDIVNIMIKKCLNLTFRHFDQQNKCAINHYSLLIMIQLLCLGFLGIILLIL